MKKTIKKHTCKLILSAGERITIIVTAFLLFTLPVLKALNVIP
jgi:hypothetical protein